MIPGVAGQYVDGMLEDMKQRAYGFTIVELLIVIVVIAILAVIAVVAYSGIQNQAVESSIRSSLKDAQTRLALEYTTNDVYPATEAAMRTLTGLKDGGSIVSTITNHSVNPSVETVTTGFGGPNGSTTIARDTSRAYTGGCLLAGDNAHGRKVVSSRCTSISEKPICIVPST